MNAGVALTLEVQPPRLRDLPLSDLTDRRADATRQQILRAAAHQFARKPYSQVNLDDILAEAQVTKGAMYFHFRSKHALALAIIDEQTNMGYTAVNELLTRKLSGLETLIDISYLLAAQDLNEDVARAGLHLVESIGRTDGLQVNLLGEWIKNLAVVVRRAMVEGDIAEQRDADDVSRLLVSVYMGTRQTSNLDDPEQFLTHLETAWAMILPGFANPDRIGYLTQFIRRRTARAISNASPRPAPS